MEIWKKVGKYQVSKIRTAGLYQDFFKTWDKYDIATTKEKLGEEKDFTEN